MRVHAKARAGQKASGAPVTAARERRYGAMRRHAVRQVGHTLRGMAEDNARADSHPGHLLRHG
jgi:hypothetical protein